MKRIPDTAAASVPRDLAAMPDVPGVRHAFLDLPGLRMHVAEAGEGDPVLLLHGGIQDWRAWRKLIPGLAERYRVVAPDLRGCGWTDAPAGGYTRDRMTGDLVAALDALGIPVTRLVSTDMGGILGFALCHDLPERVSAHVSITNPPLSAKVGLRHVKAFLPLWHQEVGSIPGLAPVLFGRGRQPLARHMLQGFSGVVEATDRSDDEGYLARLREPGRARAASAMFRHLVLPEVLRIAGGRYRDVRLPMPTLFVAAAEDRSFPPEMLEDLLGTASPYLASTEFVTVDGAGHYAAHENPERVRQVITRFFAEH
ncbi:alpha/beta fold hydrolase [Naasia sp. SYSU D00057]|uniref:alpha/beta fold hydrolase n=1 Tax=Naasia sp. SYSU D00057 TaxID=2817380 RepID=UPI001B301955|nr:alpha/beta hydrolase [Naasia sp. SYSU D00057]